MSIATAELVPTTFQRNNLVPLRNTELNTLLTCHQKWYWTFGLGLEKKDFHPTMHRGTMGHLYLAACRMHDAGKADPTFTESGGDRYDYADAILDKWTDEFIIARGLWEETSEEVITLRDSIRPQAERYHDKWGSWKKMHMTEHEITVTIANKPYILRVDGVVEDEDGLWVLETKWVKYARSQEMFDLDSQISLYVLGARSIGYDVSGVIIDQITPAPPVPQRNRDGSMSRVKRGDWQTYLRALLEAGLNPADYTDMQEKLPFCREFQRDKIIRSEYHLGAYVDQLDRRASEFDQPVKIYLTDDRIRCPYCPFNELCVELMNGGDVQGLIASAFVPRNDSADVGNDEPISIVSEN